RPELVEREAPDREMAGHVLNPVELGVPVRVGGLLHVLVRWKLMPRDCRICRSRSRPIRTGWGRAVKYAASLRRLQCVNGRPSFSGRVVAAATIRFTSSWLIRRRRPPAHRGPSAASPLALNA